MNKFNEPHPKLEYPKIVIVGMMDYGPHIWTFEDAHEAAMFLWGKYLPYYAIFKNRELVIPDVGDLDEIERLLR